MPRVRVDLGERLPRRQCGNWAARLGLEVMQQNRSLCLKQIPIVAGLQRSGETSRLCKQYPGEPPLCGEQGCPVRLPVNKLLFGCHSL